MLNLDFYHAYDRVCLPYVDKVLERMGFGQLFRGVVATLHRGATASFLLHHVTPAVPITFSAMLVYVIQVQPFLLRLEEVLPGVAFPDFEERVEAYVDDVVVVGEDENDLLIVDAICRQFEAISGAILNRSHKTAILGLGGWASRKAWPLAWVSAPDQLKTFGVVFAPTLASTVSQSWEGCLAGVQSAIHGWRARGVPSSVRGEMFWRRLSSASSGTLPKFSLCHRLWLRRPPPWLAPSCGPATSSGWPGRNFTTSGRLEGWVCPASSPGARPCWPSNCAIRWPGVAPLLATWPSGSGPRWATMCPPCPADLTPPGHLLYSCRWRMSWWNFSPLARWPPTVWPRPGRPGSMRPSWTRPPPPKGGGQVAPGRGRHLDVVVGLWGPPPPWWTSF
jgi:hypothetical protein